MKIFLLLPLVIMFGCQTNQMFSEKMKEKIVHDVYRDFVTGRLHMLFKAVDNKNWKEVEEVLADEVELDMGQGPKKMKSQEVIEVWKNALKGLDGSHHQVSNYGIYFVKRTAMISFVGTTAHKRKSKVTNLYGNYEVEMLQPEGDESNWAWKVTKFKYTNKFTR